MQRTLCPAGQLVVDWLKANGKSQVWLADQMQIGRAQLWRYLVAASVIRIDYAASIERITRIPSNVWALGVGHAQAIAPKAAARKRRTSGKRRAIRRARHQGTHLRTNGGS
jgi:hypothetical protein